MDKKLVTIMTPTYNRANLLRRLYDSILKQDCSKVEWLVVDDGSTDDTGLVVKQMIEENKLDIRYIYQENAGKYKAFNVGIDNAEGDLFFCVDSDDMLSENTILDIEVIWKEIRKLSDVAGIVALKSDLNGKLLSDEFPKEMETEHLYDLSEKHDIKGEFSIIYKTSILKRFSFPDVYPEKFVGECVLYDKIDQGYKLHVVNSVFTVCEYQEGGYTSNIIGNMIKNPTGYKIYYSQRIDMTDSFTKRLLYIIKYNAFAKISDDNSYNYEGKHKALVRLLSFTGFIGKKYYYRKMK